MMDPWMQSLCLHRAILLWLMSKNLQMLSDVYSSVISQRAHSFKSLLMWRKTMVQAEFAKGQEVPKFFFFFETAMIRFSESTVNL